MDTEELFTKLDQKFNDLDFGSKPCTTRLRAQMIYKLRTYWWEKVFLSDHDWMKFPTPLDTEPVCLGEVVQLCSEKELLRSKNLGKRSVKLLIECLGRLGLSLGMDIQGWIPPHARSKQTT